MSTLDVLKDKDSKVRSELSITKRKNLTWQRLQKAAFEMFVAGFQAT
jgi:ubiquitin C-terminal hydrolase